MSAAFERAVHAQREQALARRTAAQPAAVRELLAQRLARLRDEAARAAPAAAQPPQAPGPLASLLQHIAHSTATPSAPAGAGTAAAALPELKAVREHRDTWSRLSVEQRVHQALARVPPQAGPLNTQRLVHEALRTLRDLSPAYLHRLVTQLETLLWLEQAVPALPAARAPGATGRSTRTTPRAPGAA